MSGKPHPLRIGWLLPLCTAAIAVVVAAARPDLVGLADESSMDSSRNPIQISADWCQEWHEGEATIALFRGSCRIVQGEQVYSANNMVVWVRGTQSGNVAGDESRQRLTVYMEDSVEVQDASGSRTEQSLWVDLESDAGLTLSVRGRVAERPGTDDPLFRRALRRQNGSERGSLQQTQLTVPVPSGDPSKQIVSVQQPGSLTQPGGLRRVRISPRSFAMPFNVQSFKSENTVPPEQVTILSGGVNVLIDGLIVGGDEGFGAIDLSADRVVVWTEATERGFEPEMLQRPDASFQLYLEGNIVIRQQSRFAQLGGREVSNVVKASRAYYDGRDNRALILDAELQTYVPELDAGVRVRAERLRQNSLQSYHAQNAWFTTSQYGKPGYRIQASDIFVENRPEGWRPSEVDPQTGQPIARDHYWVTTLNPQFFVGDVPLLTLPNSSAPIEESGIPITGVSFGQNRIFGTQLRTRWNALQLLGLQRPSDVDANWELLLDYLSARGPAVGTEGRYGGVDASGNRYQGGGLGYYIHDSGNDNLGLDRRKLVPDDSNRGIIQGQHRHVFSEYGMTLDAELGYASDRNFREQYRENEFDTGKDLETLAYLRQQPTENSMWSLLVRPTVNPFENNTAWLPRGDLYFLGEPLAGGLFNWSSHTSAAYASVNQGDAPANPLDIYSPLPYYTDANGLVAMTRHEVEMPFNLGPLKVAPYALGEAAFWSDSFTSQSIDRLYGKGGVRASLQFGRVFPQVQSELFNLDGLAHKVVLEGDYSYSGSTRKLSEIPQWNEFDDNAQERFRSRLFLNTFGGVLPGEFDPRFYAVRTGAGSYVTSPYHELVDDQQVLRMGMHQRLQTKVGPPDRQRIKDWMTLDLGLSYFPNSDRDNFGSDFGLFSSRYAWHVGDRTSILAGSMYDFFHNGQQLWHVGVQSQRSLRGSAYLGLRQITAGPIDSRIATASYSYALSPKWVSTMSTAYDIGEHRNRGQSFTITRVGEWLLFHVGANYDASKNNPGVMFSVEPRLGGRNSVSSTQLSSLLGIHNN